MLALYCRRVDVSTILESQAVNTFLRMQLHHQLTISGSKTSGAVRSSDLGVDTSLKVAVARRRLWNPEKAERETTVRGWLGCTRRVAASIVLDNIW